jgi:hypothetical protein
MSEANRDPLWLAILQETEQAVRDEPLLASFLHMTVLRHSTLEDVLAFHLSSKLASPVMDARALLELFREALAADPQISRAMRADISACYDRDPADRYSAAAGTSRASMRCKASTSPTGCGSRTEDTGVFPAKPHLRSNERYSPRRRIGEA